MLQTFQRVTPWTARTCYEAALYYAQAEELPVFPLNGKVPLVGSRGFHDATTDVRTIARWWRQWPYASIGIPTGKRSGWLVLDIDARHDGFTSLQLLLAAARHRAADLHRPYQPLPLTRTAHTGGGGLHMMFAIRDDLGFVVKNTTMLGGYAGIDIRAEGGYVVVAPSMHESGRRYEWLNEEELAPFPDLLVELCRPRARASSCHTPSDKHPTGRLGGVGSPHKFCHPDYYLDLALRKAQAGSRHRYALFLACRLANDVGLSLAQAEPYMREYACRVPDGDHDFTENEALRCLTWAYEHA